MCFFSNFAPMRKLVVFAAMLCISTQIAAWHQVKTKRVNSLQVITNEDFEALPVIQLGSDDRIVISFDEMSHNYHRMVYHLEPCNPDWTPTEGLFESDWLIGLNDQPIDDYENSVNTTTLYTHYSFTFPNEQTNIRMSGNYRIHIIDEDAEEEVAVVELRVWEPKTWVGLSVTANTDIDFNSSHQQVNMSVMLNGLRVNRMDEQIQTIVMQNGREDNMKINVAPNYITTQNLQWEHNRSLIFDAGNEYHKFEVLDPKHISMGLANAEWKEDTRQWHVWPFTCEPRRSYLYDEDTNGAFLLRNSDNYEAERTSEYVEVHYQLKPAIHYDHAKVIVNGRWTTNTPNQYVMTYNEDNHSYDVTITQKLGYYNYQLLLQDMDGTTHSLPEEGSFFQTENKYEALVYYKDTGGRMWRLVGYQEITFKAR